MSYRRMTSFVLWFALVFQILGLLPVYAQSDVTITLSSLEFVVGERATLEATIDCESVCSVFAITLNFDPALVQFDEAELGPYLGVSMVLENKVDNQAGTIRLAAVSLNDTTDSDQNLLFTIALDALAPGTFQITAARLEVGDMNAKSAVLAGGLITVTSIPDATQFAATQEAEPVATATMILTPTPTRRARVVENCGNGLPWQFSVGDQGEVSKRESTPSTLRELPGGHGMGFIQPGETFTILDGPVCTHSNGISWWYVQSARGVAGWVSEGNDGIYWITRIES